MSILSLQGSRPRLFAVPRFSNISEHSEDEDANPTQSRSTQNTFGGLLNESARKENEQRPKKKTGFEIVDSDDDEEDDAVVSRPRRSLDTGMSQQRPSLSRLTRAISPPGSSEDRVRTVEGRPGLSRSSRGISPPAASSSEDRDRTVEGRPGLSRSSRGISPPAVSSNEDRDRLVEGRPGLSRSSRGISPPAASSSEDRDRAVEGRPGLSRSSRGISPPAASSGEERVRTIEGRPGLSRASGNLAVNRDLEDSESGREETPQRPGLMRSKRPMSGQRPSLSRRGSRDKQAESPRAAGRSSMPADSEEDSDEDDVIVTGKKTKTTGGDGRAGGRPSLTRKTPASTRKNFHNLHEKHTVEAL